MDVDEEMDQKIEPDNDEGTEREESEVVEEVGAR